MMGATGNFSHPMTKHFFIKSFNTVKIGLLLIIDMDFLEVYIIWALLKSLKHFCLSLDQATVTAIHLEPQHLLERGIQIFYKQQVIFINETNIKS